MITRTLLIASLLLPVGAMAAGPVHHWKNSTDGVHAQGSWQIKNNRMYIWGYVKDIKADKSTAYLEIRFGGNNAFAHRTERVEV